MSNRQERRKRGTERHLFVDDNGVREITALGQGVEINGGAQLDKLLSGSQLDDTPPGVHVWAMFAVFRCPRPDLYATQQAILDAESLLMLTGPGCYRCERVYSPEIAGQPCEGEP